VGELEHDGEQQADHERGGAVDEEDHPRAVEEHRDDERPTEEERLAGEQLPEGPPRGRGMTLSSMRASMAF